MTIMVTGASGLVGSQLCKRLVEEGYPVVGMVHNVINPLLPLLCNETDFKMCVWDIRNYEDVDRMIERAEIDTIFHTAAHLPYTQEKDLFGVNVAGTANILRASIRYGVKEIIYTSTMSVYTTPPEYLPVDEIHPTYSDNAYGKTKAAGELGHVLAARDNGMKIIILRYAGIYGRGAEKNRVIEQFIHNALLGNNLIVNGNGQHSSDFVYIDDIIQGTILAWKNGGGQDIYNIGSGRDIKLRILAELIIYLVKSQSRIIINGNSNVTRNFRFYLDISKISELGYRPHSLEEGLRKYIQTKESVKGVTGYAVS